MAKKKFTTTQLIIGAAVIGTVGYLVLRKPTPAKITGTSNGTGTGTGGEGSSSGDTWSYRVMQQGNTWVAIIFDPAGNSQQLAPQNSDGSAAASAQAAIMNYGGVPVRV